MLSPMSPDKGVSWYVPHIHNLRFMKAQYVRHAFRPHSHDYWVLGIVETGLQSFTYKRQRLVTSPGRLIIINPGEVHTGEAAVSQGFVYRALYPPVELMSSFTREFALRSRNVPVFQGGLVDDLLLFQRIQRVHYRSERGATLLEIEEALTHFFVDLIRHYAEPSYTIRDYRHAPHAVTLVRDYIEAHYSANISLADLAALTHISPFHLSRLFKQHMQVPPHRYLQNVRVRHAEQLLKAGLPIADVAFDTGFSSQSHLTRTFKQFLGTTPGEFVKASKIV